MHTDTPFTQKSTTGKKWKKFKDGLTWILAAGESFQWDRDDAGWRLPLSELDGLENDDPRDRLVENAIDTALASEEPGGSSQPSQEDYPEYTQRYYCTPEPFSSSLTQQSHPLSTSDPAWPDSFDTKSEMPQSKGLAELPSSQTERSKGDKEYGNRILRREGPISGEPRIK
eukprot:CCRYP_019099-RA/>CCRYP_019099-RA protein AED:0.43 eAED:0.43 QI:0/0/0/1/0.5/0.66/3/0/170